MCFVTQSVNCVLFRDPDYQQRYEDSKAESSQTPFSYGKCFDAKQNKIRWMPCQTTMPNFSFVVLLYSERDYMAKVREGGCRRGRDAAGV